MSLSLTTKLQETGFILDDSEEFGCSPDGLVVEQGGLEIKCPSDSVHVSYLRAGKVPAKYYQQVQGCYVDNWERVVGLHVLPPRNATPISKSKHRNEKFIEAMAEQVLKPQLKP